MTKVHHQIQYIEFLSPDFARIKQFYQAAFAWEFTDYGTGYTAFAGQYVDGGFALGEPVAGSIMPIVYSDDLEQSLDAVITAGGKIVKAIFEFLGGRRFEFTDPDGNRLAVWAS